MQLSPHFSLEEAVLSQEAERRGINNTPTSDTIVVMKLTALRLELVRDTLGAVPLHINSWYRCVSLNNALGSKLTSQHIVGEAVDFVAPKFGTPLQICQKLADHIDALSIDQLILEHSWVHVSFNSSPDRNPRKQILSLLSSGGYAVGLTDKFGKPY